MMGDIISMETTVRRERLQTRPNPGSHLDYVVKLEGRLPPSSGRGQIAVSLKYVPHRVVLEPAPFGEYLEALGSTAGASLEEIAVAILEDINNETVARWVQVAVAATEEEHPGVNTHGVMLEDRQPKWDNPALLSRLRRY